MKTTHIFSGHAQLPAGTDLYEKHKYAAVLVEIDMQTGMIVNCDVPIFCQMANEFMSDILKGRSIDRDIDEIIDNIEKRLHTLSKKAVITSLQVIHNRYKAIRKRALEQAETAIN